ncbi:MAG: hypothetical protein AMJ42_02645 [Deltaproteobacteria bacterium DG_8]|nr:MAG: hypothetical protein AMJ42_02645 [Deltaproteobacteria bacterium DG_8]
MSESFIVGKYKLSRNPFPPAASGIDVERDLYIPSKWEEKIGEYYETLHHGEGAKAFPIVGEYGSGKTVLLKGYLKDFFENKRIKTIYFENPGVKFYDLANTLMRTFGRYGFSKAIWERCKEYLPEKGQRSLFPMSFSDMLSTLRTKINRENKAKELSDVIKNKLNLTDEDEVAYRLGLMIVETASKPYFSYRDFVAGAKGSLVAEREESKYFKAIIKAIIKTYSVEGVAFLLDEFEEIAFHKRMTRKQTYEYLATLRSLIEVSESEENLWMILAMTPEAADETKEMNIALWERFTHQRKETVLKLEPLTEEESKNLIKWWLNGARDEEKLKKYRNKLFPFPEDIERVLQRPEIRLPRPLVRIGFFTLARAEEGEIEPPVPIDFITKIMDELYPPGK